MYINNIYRNLKAKCSQIIIIALLFVIKNTSAQDSDFGFRLWGVNADYVINSHNEPYSRIGLSRNSGAINSVNHRWFFANYISYTKSHDFNPRINKVNQDFSLCTESTIGNYIKISKHSKLYFNNGTKFGISQRQKSVVQNTNGDYDISYKYKFYLGLPLSMRLIVFSKKPFAIGIHVYTHVQRYMEYGAGVNILWGKYYR